MIYFTVCLILKSFNSLMFTNPLLSKQMHVTACLMMTNVIWVWTNDSLMLPSHGFLIIWIRLPWADPSRCEQNFGKVPDVVETLAKRQLSANIDDMPAMKQRLVELSENKTVIDLTMDSEPSLLTPSRSVEVVTSMTTCGSSLFTYGSEGEEEEVRTTLICRTPTAHPWLLSTARQTCLRSARSH